MVEKHSRAGYAMHMKARVSELLVCPATMESLVLHSQEADGDEIIEGELVSAVSAHRYPITRGIPRLLPNPGEVSEAAQETVDRFGAQWNDFDFIGDHYEKQFLGWISPNGPEAFEDKIVLEGGCGKGRHSALAAKWGAKEVFAIDLGSAVEAAYRNTRDYENVHVIQADLFNLPLKPKSVDVAFSVGVLHHTPSPKGAFMALLDCVKEGGKMIAWIYGRENNEWIVNFIDPVRTKLTSKLPHRWVYHLSKIPAAIVYGLGKGVYQPLSRAPFDVIGNRLFYQAYINVITKFPFDEVHSIVHDHLTPPIANYIERAEFQSWWNEADMQSVTIGWHNENSWRGTGTRPQQQ